MSTNLSVDMVQPWRKSFPICKPPVPGDPVDAERFILEFPEGADKIDVGQDWTLGDVARGDHEGGLAATAPVIGGNNATVLTKAIPKEDEKFGRFCATLLNLPR